MSNARPLLLTYGFWLLAALTAVGVAQVALSQQRNQLTEGLVKLERQKSEAQDRLSKLKVEIAALTGPEQLRIAADRLGMHPALPPQVIRQ